MTPNILRKQSPKNNHFLDYQGYTDWTYENSADNWIFTDKTAGEWPHC